MIADVTAIDSQRNAAAAFNVDLGSWISLFGLFLYMIHSVMCDAEMMIKTFTKIYRTFRRLTVSSRGKLYALLCIDCNASLVRDPTASFLPTTASA